MNHTLESLPPILLTSSVVAMDKSVLLKDEQDRIFYTLESIGMWLKISPGSPLIICDGSNFDFGPLMKERYPKAIIESIFFMNDPLMLASHGKGYGEGEIIKYALKNSKLIAKSNFFVKCTAKLWVDNYGDCLKEWNGKFIGKAYFSNVFSLKKAKLVYFDTRFYMVDKHIYESYFINAHLSVGGVEGINIEDKFLMVCLKEKLYPILFRQAPIIRGVGGATGKYYRNHLTRRVKENLRNFILRHSKKFSHFF